MEAPEKLQGAFRDQDSIDFEFLALFIAFLCIFGQLQKPSDVHVCCYLWYSCASWVAHESINFLFLWLCAVLLRILDSLLYHRVCIFVAICGTPAHRGQLMRALILHVCCYLWYSCALWGRLGYHWVYFFLGISRTPAHCVQLGIALESPRDAPESSRNLQKGPREAPERDLQRAPEGPREFQRILRESQTALEGPRNFQSAPERPQRDPESSEKPRDRERP